MKGDVRKTEQARRNVFCRGVPKIEAPGQATRNGAPTTNCRRENKFIQTVRGSVKGPGSRGDGTAGGEKSPPYAQRGHSLLEGRCQREGERGKFVERKRVTQRQ